jgi:Tfp pilus assembly ATPase PilU
MKITAEIEKILLERNGEITLIEATYPNGGKVKGTIYKIRKKPLTVSVLKQGNLSIGNARHKLVFDHVVSLLITFKNGEQISFE